MAKRAPKAVTVDPGTKHAGGRPSEMTEEVVKKIVEGISLGMSRDEVAAFAGKHRSTIFLWLKAAEEAIEGGTATPEQEEFFNDIKAAESDGIVTRLRTIQKGDPGWQGSAWIQERRYSRQWAMQQKIEHTGKDGAPLFANLHSASESE